MSHVLIAGFSGRSAGCHPQHDTRPGVLLVIITERGECLATLLPGSSAKQLGQALIAAAAEIEMAENVCQAEQANA